MMERLVQLLGAEAVQMRYSDVLPALQTAKIDGAENNFPSYQSTGHYLVATYFLEDEHSRIPEAIVASNAVKNKLPPEDWTMIEQAAREAGVYQRALWQEYEQRTRQTVIDSGCIVYTMTAEEKAAFMAKTESMYEEFATDARDVVLAIESMREE